MATGRLPGNSPGLQVTRWSKSPANGTTSLSGTDDNGVGLTYTAGYETVYLNGVLLVRGSDYTATDGTTVVLSTATVTGDIVNVFGTQATPVNGSIGNNIVTAKGDLIVGGAASTPIAKPVGTDGQLLYADSTQTGGIKWAAAPSSGGMTLISSQTLSGATGLSFTSIPQTYTDLLIRWSGLYQGSSGNTHIFRLNNDSTANIYRYNGMEGNPSGYAGAGTDSRVGTILEDRYSDVETYNGKGWLRIRNYASTSLNKVYELNCSYSNSSNTTLWKDWIGTYVSTSAITSVDLVRQYGSGTMSNTTGSRVEIWGVK